MDDAATPPKRQLYFGSMPVFESWQQWVLWFLTGFGYMLLLMPLYAAFADLLGGRDPLSHGWGLYFWVCGFGLLLTTLSLWGWSKVSDFYFGVLRSCLHPLMILASLTVGVMLVWLTSAWTGHSKEVIAVPFVSLVLLLPLPMEKRE